MPNNQIQIYFTINQLFLQVFFCDFFHKVLVIKNSGSYNLSVVISALGVSNTYYRNAFDTGGL